MVALGFGLATICIYNRAPAFGVDSNRIIDLMIVMLVSGIFGARLFYVLQNLDYYRANLLEIIDLSRGGLVWYGAFLAGLGGCALYVKTRSMSFLLCLDLIAPYIAMAQAVGRIGCFLNGCCYGMRVSPEYPLAIPSVCDGAWHHPTQIYSATVLIFIFMALRLWQDRRRFNGEIFLGYCLLYSLNRFLMEFVRGDNPRAFFGFTISQVISCAIFALCLGIIIYMTVARWKKR